MFAHPLTDPRRFDILVFDPGWWGSDARSNTVSPSSNGERIMRSDVRALLRPLVRTVGLLLAVAVAVIACLMVLAVMVWGN